MDGYKKEEHSWYKPKRMPWSVCRYCGLVSLNNQLTRWSIDKGCNYKDHPGYKDAVLRYTKLF